MCFDGGVYGNEKFLVRNLRSNAARNSSHVTPCNGRQRFEIEGETGTCVSTVVLYEISCIVLVWTEISGMSVIVVTMVEISCRLLSKKIVHGQSLAQREVYEEVS